MIKAVIALALFGCASAGNVYGGLYGAGVLGYGAPAVYAAGVPALGYTAAVAQSHRDASHIATGYAQIHNAAVGQAIDAQNAAIRDHNNLNRAAVTQAVINADGAASSRLAANAIQNYAAVRDATIQADQFAFSRYAAAAQSQAGIIGATGLGLGVPAVYGGYGAVAGVPVGLGGVYGGLGGVYGGLGGVYGGLGGVYGGLGVYGKHH